MTVKIGFRLISNYMPSEVIKQKKLVDIYINLRAYL